MLKLKWKLSVKVWLLGRQCRLVALRKTRKILCSETNDQNSKWSLARIAKLKLIGQNIWLAGGMDGLNNVRICSCLVPAVALSLALHCKKSLDEELGIHCLKRPKWNICVVPVAYQQNLGWVGREIIKFCYNIQQRKLKWQNPKKCPFWIIFLQRPF